jgi:hypothetical protein
MEAVPVDKSRTVPGKHNAVTDLSAADAHRREQAWKKLAHGGVQFLGLSFLV